MSAYLSPSRGHAVLVSQDGLRPALGPSLDGQVTPHTTSSP